MKLIVGLGNPGDKYLLNRHNVGFQFLDYLFNKFQVASGKYQEKTGSKEFALNKKFDAEIAEINVNNDKIILVKPQTFMNNSGQAVAKVALFFKLESLDDLILVHDDLDIRLGEYKIQKAKGPKIHGGVLSTEKELGATDFWRLRIGVDNREKDNRIPGEAYVLQNFSQNESVILNDVFMKALSEVDAYVLSGDAEAV